MDGSDKLSIDTEEFTRLQTQLIDLRTVNYQLKEDKSKADKELNQLQLAHQASQKELEKLNKTIQRSKKAKEYQLMVEENESLLIRLQTQEDDFNLQNKTLMDEIAKVCEQNDELQKKLKISENGSLAENIAGSNTPEILRLRAENVALQKSLQASVSESREDMIDSSDASKTEEDALLRLNLATLEEENNLLQEQMTVLKGKEDSYLTEIDTLKKEVQKQAEKLRRKQESVVQLQEEKEKLILKNTESCEQIVRDKEQIIDGLRSQLQTYEQMLEQSNEKLLEELSSELESTKRCLQEEKMASRQFQNDAANAKLASDSFADQVLSMKEDMLKVHEDLQSMTKLAESRKSLIDKMAIEEQKVVADQRRREDELVSQYKLEIEKLSQNLNLEQVKAQELSLSLSELTDLKEKLIKYEAQKSSHENVVQKLKDEYESEISKLKEALKEQEDVFQQKIESMKEELETSQTEKQQLTDNLQSLEESLAEKTASVKIVEKKSSALIKDLKRQLQQLQKREEKLQNQLLLENGGSETNLVGGAAAVPQENRQHNHSRESSSTCVKDLADTSPDTSFNTSIVDVNESETKILMDKIAELQQEKWLLEEKVHHLENTGSALAEDLLQKSTIIQNYFMENKADHGHSSSHLSSPGVQNKISPMRLVQWAKTPSKDDTMAEVNRKMQRALEEALMKNIHLQKDVEMLSTELHNQAAPNKEESPP